MKEYNSLNSNKKYKILFVCLGNICRSPAAQAVMERIVSERGVSDKVEIDSAGISGYHRGDLPDKRMRVHAARRGLQLTHLSRPVTYGDFGRFDLIVGMDDANVDDLRDMAMTLEDESKIVQISRFFRNYSGQDCIPDPYYGGSEGFENVLDLLDDACNTIADLIQSGEIRDIENKL